MSEKQELLEIIEESDAHTVTVMSVPISHTIRVCKIREGTVC